MPSKEDAVDYIGTIRNSSADIEALKSQIKTKKEMVDDHVHQKPEWLEYESKKEETAIAKAKLDAALARDADYNNSMTQLAELKDTVKDKQDTLSTFIVGYHAETKETQVELGANGDARQLIIKGRLGKKQKYQTSLFSKESEQ